MSIDKVADNKILISMCNSDIKQLMGVIDRKTDLLEIVARFACNKTGIEVNNSNLLIEKITHQNGYLLLVTIKADGGNRVKYKINKTPKYVCYYFDDIDNFLTAYNYIKRYKTLFNSCNTIVLNNNKFVITFENIIPKDSINHFMCEYGRRKIINRLSYAILQEKSLKNY